MQSRKEYLPVDEPYTSKSIYLMPQDVSYETTKLAAEIVSNELIIVMQFINKQCDVTDASQ